MRHWFALPLAILVCTPGSLVSKESKLTPEDRVAIVRGLMAEYATAKTLLPRSKKPLLVEMDGTYDKEVWEESKLKNGPAARVGDQVQITKVEIEDNEVKLELNGGWRSGAKWYQRIEVGSTMGGGPVAAPGTIATSGTILSLHFKDGVPPLQTAEFKKILAPFLDFDKHSATEQYAQNLPPEVRKAIEDKRVIEGMDKEQVQLSMGRPRSKIRETKDGDETEDWIYGLPPGRMVFVTFGSDNKVIKVKEDYAGLGGSQVEIKGP